METEADPLLAPPHVPAPIPEAAPLPKPSIEHWRAFEMVMNPFFGIVCPIAFVSTAGGSGGGAGAILAALVLALLFAIFMATRPIRHTFAFEGDKITYVEYRCV